MSTDETRLDILQACALSVLAAQVVYYRAEADDLELRARAFPKHDKLHGAILRRRDAALALAEALEAQAAA